MVKNIKFSYLYRDGSNYKNYGFVIFANNLNIDLADLERIIKTNLIDGTWFYANEWELPSLFFSNYNPHIDPTWHEFESIEYTDEPAKEWRNISPKLRAQIGKNPEQALNDSLNKTRETNFELLLQEIRKEAAQNGLTEEIL